MARRRFPPRLRGDLDAAREVGLDIGDYWVRGSLDAKAWPGARDSSAGVRRRVSGERSGTRAISPTICKIGRPVDPNPPGNKVDATHVSNGEARRLSARGARSWASKRSLCLQPAQNAALAAHQVEPRSSSASSTAVIVFGVLHNSAENSPGPSITNLSSTYPHASLSSIPAAFEPADLEFQGGLNHVFVPHPAIEQLGEHYLAPGWRRSSPLVSIASQSEAWRSWQRLWLGGGAWCSTQLKRSWNRCAGNRLTSGFEASGRV